MNNNSSRKYYIDNIRILCILLLFPFHTAMIFNNFGESWYIHSKTNLVLADIINRSIYPWWMSGLFALAGISTVYSLNHRSAKQYRNERYKKLLIPFLCALVFIVPVQGFIADKYYNNYNESYLNHFSTFLSVTNWSGYDGHFTPGHTWFILYLFIISIILLPFMIWYKNKPTKINYECLTLIKIIPMFLIPMITKPILNIGGKGGKSIGEFAAYFLLGYFILSCDKVQERLEKNAVRLGVAWLSLIIIRCILYFSDTSNALLCNIEAYLLGWIGILAMIGLGKRFLDFNSKFTKYFVPAEFPLYIFHQSIIVIAAYIILKFINNPVIEYLLILVSSFIVSIILYEICRRFKITSFMFAIKKK